MGAPRLACAALAQKACRFQRISHGFPGDYMDVSFVYDLQCVAAKRGPWEHGWWNLGGI